MRVLAVSKMFPRPDKLLSGVFVLEQAKSLAEYGVDVSVLCPTARRLLSGSGMGADESGNDVCHSRVDDVPVTYVPYAHVPLRVSTRFEVWSLVSRILPVVRSEHARAHIRVLHAHQLFPTGYATAVVGSRLGIPTVCTAHGSDVHTHPSRNRGIARYTRATLRMVARTVSVSEDLARRIALLEPRAERAEVIYNGIDPERFAIVGEQTKLRRRLGLPESGVGICFVGRLTAAKGILELIAAFRAVQNTDPAAWLVVLGDGPLRDKLASWVPALQGRLILAGPVPHERVAEYLNAANVFVLPSHGEGVPVAMLEAMACGLPVVATAVGGIPEVLTDGVMGFLVRPQDLDALTERIGRLLTDAGLRRELGRAARKRIDDGFYWRHGSAKLIRLYGVLGTR